MAKVRVVGLVGGSGFEGPVFSGMRELPGGNDPTPYGVPSSPLYEGVVAGTRAVFLLRHGLGHVLPPHAVPYAANMYALRRAGATEVLAVATVGGVSPEMPPGAVSIPDDLVDRTSGREGSIYRDAGTGVAHVDFTSPFDPGLRQALLEAAARAGVTVVDGGVYWCMQGPRLETRAEIRMVKVLGGDMVGMTACPEAALSRELGLPYALVSPSVNWAAGLADSSCGISLEDLAAESRSAMERVGRIVREFCAGGEA